MPLFLLCLLCLWFPLLPFLYLHHTYTGTTSLTAAVRRSSTGSFLRDVSAKCTQLCDAGAYMHWWVYTVDTALLLGNSVVVTTLSRAPTRCHCL